MWKLESRAPGAGGLFVFEGSELLVSRAPGAWLLLPGDASVSRKHASLHLVHSLADLKRGKAATLMLEDLNAKNGTYVRHSTNRPRDPNVSFVNESHRINPGSRVQLQHGDVVRFGLYASYRVVFSPLVVATSMLPDNEAVLRDLHLLGASFSKDWNSRCTHLVMETIKLSAKVACALASGGLIVTPAFLPALLQAVKDKSPVLPPAHDFLPAITEPSIQPSPSLFAPNGNRKSVFVGKNFCFGTEKGHRRLSSIIRLAGGECGVLKADHVELLCSGSALLLRTAEDSSSPTPAFTSALNALKKAGLHVIPESDIVLAVLYCSTERFCNPCVSQQLLLDRPAPHTQTQSSVAIFAVETQDVLSATSTNKSSGTKKTSTWPGGQAKVIPETPSSSCSSKKSDLVNDSTPPFNKQADHGKSPSKAKGSNKYEEECIPKLLEVEKPTPSLNVPSLYIPEPTIANTDNLDRSSKKRYRSHENIANESAAKRSAPPRPGLPDTQDIDAQGEGDVMEEGSLNISTFAPPLVSTQIYEDEQNGFTKPAENALLKIQMQDPTSVRKTNTDAHKVVTGAVKTAISTVVTCVPPTPTPLSQASPADDGDATLPTPGNDVVVQSNPRSTMVQSRALAEISPSLDALLNSTPLTLGQSTQYCSDLQTTPLPSLEPPSLDGLLNFKSSPKDPAPQSSSRGRPILRDPFTPLDPNLSKKEAPSTTSDGFQLPAAAVRRRKVQQVQQLPECANSSAIHSVVGGIKRTRSTIELEENKRQKPAPPAEVDAVTTKEELCTPSSIGPTHADCTVVPSTSDGFISGKRPRLQKSSNKTTDARDGEAGAFHAPDPGLVKADVAQSDSEVKPSVSELDKNITVCRTLLVSLVLRTSILGDDYQPRPASASGNGSKNFKRFLKVRHGGSAASLPRIIGGSDLVPHTSITSDGDIQNSGARSLWLSQHPEVTRIIEQEDRERDEDAEQDEVDSTHGGARSSSRTGSASRPGSIASYFAGAGTANVNGARATHSGTGQNRAAFAKDPFSQYQMPSANVKRRVPRTRI